MTTGPAATTPAAKAFPPKSIPSLPAKGHPLPTAIAPETASPIPAKVAAITPVAPIAPVPTETSAAPAKTISFGKTIPVGTIGPHTLSAAISPEMTRRTVCTGSNALIRT